MTRQTGDNRLIAAAPSNFLFADHSESRERYFKTYNRRLSVGRIRGRISAYLLQVPIGLPPIRRNAFSDRVVRLVHAILWAAVDRDNSLAPLRFGRLHLAPSFKRARGLDTEVAQCRRAGCVEWW